MDLFNNLSKDQQKAEIDDFLLHNSGYSAMIKSSIREFRQTGHSHKPSNMFRAWLMAKYRYQSRHDDLVLRNKILRERPDLPVDRIRCHEQVVKLQEKNEKMRDLFRELLLHDDCGYFGRTVNDLRGEIEALLGAS